MQKKSLLLLLLIGTALSNIGETGANLDIALNNIGETRAN